LKSQAIAGIIKFLMFYKSLTILLVISLLAEHSFWFSGSDIVDQLPHAVQSFKSQNHINITIVMAEVEKAFNNVGNQEDPGWLIQWVINNKLVCNLFLNTFYNSEILNKNHK